MFKKDIDRLFQEKFKDFEVNPSPKVWSKINKELKPKKAFLNFRLIAIVASVIVMLGVLYVANMNSIPLVKENTEKLVKSKFIISNQNKINSSANHVSVKNNNKSITNNVNTQSIQTTSKTKEIQKNNSLVVQTIKKVILNNKKENSSVVNNNLNKQYDVSLMNTKSKKSINLNNSNTSIVANLISKNNGILVNKTNSNTIVINSKNKKTEVLNKNTSKFELVKLKPIVLIANNYKFKKIQLQQKSIQSEINSIAKDVKTEINKWEIGTVISPIYYASMTKGSPISNTISSNKKTNSNSYAYGLNVAYNLSEKWSVKTGVRKTNLSYLTKDVGVVLQVINDTNLSNSDYRFVSNSEMSYTTDVTFLGDLKQELKYIEIPIEVKYTLVDKKINVNLNGGVSTLFLDKNQVTFERALSSVINLGEALNVNKTSYSVNFGFDTGLNLSKSIKYSISPIFKYHLNTFSEKAGGFKPYSIGINTGLYYSF